MSTSFNPYHAWLGLAESLTQPTYFQLLGLDEAEDDDRTIGAAADRAASRVRGCRPGEHAAAWAALLDEIRDAKKNLTDRERRAKYRRSRTLSPADRVEPAVLSPAHPRTPNPNMYPPGMAPAIAPLELSRARTDLSLSNPADNLSLSSAQGMNSSTAKVDLQTPMMPTSAPLPVAAAAYSPPESLPMSPTGVPYLQPADSAYQSAAMSPMAPASNLYPATASPMAPLSFGSAPTAGPMSNFSAQALPMAMPLNSAHQQNSVPIAQAVPFRNAASPLDNAPTSFPAPATSTDSVNPNSAALIAARHASSGVAGPIMFGLALGIVLLAGFGGYVVWNSRSPEGNPVAQNQPGDSQPATAMDNSPSTAPTSPESQDGNRSVTDETESPRKPPTPAMSQLPSLVDGPPKSEDMPSASDKSDTPTKPNPKPEVKSTPDTKPKADDKPVPTPTKPDEPAEMPKPTKDELVKLGRALQKARENIGEHEFDKADAFLSAAGEMPRLPEHQAMIDRLKLLRESVQQYRKAIETSVGNLKAGESFQVGESNVGIVEIGPDRLVFRAAGQNRRYTLRELPVGLAAALAAQSLAKDDPSTLMLKGAYVFASPLAKADDLTKAREFLEQASAESEPAKELLKLMSDKYDFAAPSSKK